MCKNVAVIDDDELFRAGLTRLIDSFDEFKVVLSLNSNELTEKMENTDKAVDESFHLILFCPPLPITSGMVLCEKVAKYFKPSPLMIFSNVYSKFSLMKALESGVSAYYTKGISPYDLEDILLELTSKENFSDIKLEPRVRDVLMNEEPMSFTFTEAEEQVLRLVCEQKSSAEISNDLGISVRTVESRKRNMMLKTQSKNMIGVVMIFMKSGQYQTN